MNPFFVEHQDRGFTVVEFTTESLMNPLELEGIGQAIYRIVDEMKQPKLLLDFSKVKYLSSQAIGILLTVNKKMNQRKPGSVVLCGVGPQLLQLLKITRLDQILTIKANKEEVLPPTAGA